MPSSSRKSPSTARTKPARKLSSGELTKNLDALPPGRQVMLKLTIPDVPDLYSPLVNDKRVARVVALSGGYTRADACQRSPQSRHHRELFRALVGDLRHSMSDAEFNTTLAKIDRRDLSSLYREGLIRGGEAARRFCSALPGLSIGLEHATIPRKANGGNNDRSGDSRRHGGDASGWSVRMTS